MAEDVTQGPPPIHRHLTCTHCVFTTPEQNVLRQHQLDAHTPPPQPQSATTAQEEVARRHLRHHHHPLVSPSQPSAPIVTDPDQQVNNIPFEAEEINLSPVYEHPQSLHGPPVARTYHCSQCFKSTDSPREHLHHLVQEHGLDLAIYECDVCDYATKYKQKLAHHRSIYHCSASPAGIGSSVVQNTLKTTTLPQTLHTEYDMLGSSAMEDDGRRHSHVHKMDNKGSTSMDVDMLRMKDINENVKQQYNTRKTIEPDLICNEKLEVGKHNQTMANSEEQDLLCNEMVANDSAEFELKSTQSKGPIRDDDDDGDHLVIDLGDIQNQNTNINNNNVDSTPAILKAVSLATANSMVARPTMVPVTLSVKRDVMDIRATPTPAVTSATSATTKLTKKGTVPVREAVDPAKYVRLQDVDGVRYACSKCGNVYKWRKSLNKHWKEKHDGEIPVPASGSFTNILNIPHIKGGGTPHYSTPKSSATSSRTLITSSMLNSTGAISSYALDKYIVDMGAQSGGRSIQSPSFTTNSSPASATAAAAVLATRNINMLTSGGFNSMVHPTNIPLPTVLNTAKQHNHNNPLSSMRFMKPDITATTNALSKFPNFSGLPTYPRDKMRLPTQLPPPAAHGRSFLKHEVQDEDSADDMPLDLSKKSTPTTSILNLTSASPSLSISRPGSSMMGDQPLDFSVKSNPGSERSTQVHMCRSSRGNLDHDESMDHQSWMRTTSTPECDVYNNLQCYKCPFVASDKGTFEEHLEQHTNYSQYPQCAQCKQHFSSNDELTQHFGLHHLHILNQINMADDDGQDTELSSGSTLEAGKQLYQYLTKPCESQEQKCAVCNAKFPWHRDLSRHFTHLHPDLPNPYSKKRTLETDSMENEPRQKVSKFERYGSNEGKQGTTEGELECEQCTFVARDMAEMARHQLVHSFNRPHACTMCGFSSKSREELQSHMWKYHPTQAEELALMASSGGATPVSLTKSRSAPIGNNEESPSQNAADTSGSSAHSGEFGYDDVIIVTPNTTDVPLVRGRKLGKGGPSSSAEILLPYKCSVCEYRARWPSEITQHMKNHSDEKPYHCPRCTYKSKWKWDVVKHLKRCGGGTVKDVIDTSRQHRKSETDDRSSPFGNQTVVKQLQFRNSSPKPTTLSNGPPNVTVLPASSSCHMASQELLRSYSPTSVSSEVMNYAQNTSSPTNSISSEPASVNDPTDAQSAKAKNQVFHSLVNQGLYHCLQCPFVANSPAELKRHCRVHSDEKPFTCQTCGYSSKWKCDLKKHVRTYNHRPAPRPSDCQDDDRQRDGSGKFLSGDDDNMSSSDEMSIDLMHAEPCSVSPAESPIPKPTLYKCDKCQYVTYKKNFLDGHMKIHRTTHEKSGKLKCKQCDFNASDLPSFLQHKLTHSTQQTPDTPPTVVADSVPVSLDSKVELETSPQRHRRKPMKYLTCNKCPYSCLQPARVDVHESLHDHCRPSSLTCEFCDYNVYNRALLIQHMKLHSDFDSWYNVHGHTLDDDLLKEAESLEMDDAELEESLRNFSTTGGDAVNLSSKNGSGGMKLMLANPAESGQGFQCSKCTFHCESRIWFESHIRQHGSRQQYQCEHCDWSVGRLNHLYKHVREVHPQQLTLRESSDGNNTSREGTPVAEDKPANLSRLTSSSNRRKPQHKSKTCIDCGYISGNYNKMSVHKIKHESENIKKCHYCSETMKTTRSMQEHLFIVHDVDVGSAEEEEENSIFLLENNRKRTRSQSSMDDSSSRQLIDVKGQQVYVIHNGNRKVFACPMCSYRTNNSSHCVSHVQQHGSGKKYTCEYCDYSLEHLSHIFHHMKMCHSNEIDTTDTETEAPSKTVKKGSNGTSSGGKLVCLHCPYGTKSMEMLQRHMERHDYNGQFTCKQCDFSVDKESLLQEHLHVHVSNGQIKRRVLSTPKSQKRNTKVVYKPVLQKAARPTPGNKGRMKIRYRCAKCPYLTACKSNIIKHRRLHMVASKYKCQQCDYSATRYFLLKQHLSFHTEGGTNEEGIYNDIYLGDGELSSHDTNRIKMAKSDKILNCIVCPFSSYKIFEMEKHQRLHMIKKKFSCDYCTFSSAGIKQMNQHRLLHSDQAGFQVKPDPKSLLRKTSNPKYSTLPKLRIVLKPAANMIVRKDNALRKLYNCKECPFECNKRQSYESHTRLHGAAGLYKCEYCSYTVAQINLLHQHIRLHESPKGSEKRFVKRRLRCSKCPYHTHSKPLLDLHFKMHSCQSLNLIDSDVEHSKFYYNCERCPYQTNNKNNFENHKGQHKFSSKLCCPYCDYSSSRTAQLGSHIKLHFPGSQLDGPALHTLISGANPSEVLIPDAPLSLDDGDTGMPSIGDFCKGSLEPSNNNNKDIHMGAICQFCERNFADEAEKDRHEQQHLIGAS